MTARFPVIPRALRAIALCVPGFLSLTASLSDANPYPADELSLLNGAEYFDRYCTECHGWNPADQFVHFYTEDPEEEQQEAEIIAELIATVEDPEQKKVVIQDPEDETWPAWAGPPPEKTQTEMEALEAAVIEDFNHAVDEVYGTNTSAYGWDDDDDAYDYEKRDNFDEELDKIYDSNQDRDPGATDLLDPYSYANGTDSDELYYSIAYGTGSTMPGFLEVLGTEEAVWDLVNYIQSLWVDETVDDGELDIEVEDEVKAHSEVDVEG